MREARYADHRAGWRMRGILGTLDLAQDFLQRVDVEGEDAADDDIVPGRACGFQLNGQPFDHALILLLVVALRDRLVIVVGRRLPSDEDHLARPFYRDDARVGRMLVELRRVDEISFHADLPHEFDVQARQEAVEPLRLARSRGRCGWGWAWRCRRGARRRAGPGFEIRFRDNRQLLDESRD